MSSLVISFRLPFSDFELLTWCWAVRAPRWPSGCSPAARRPEGGSDAGDNWLDASFFTPVATLRCSRRCRRKLLALADEGAEAEQSGQIGTDLYGGRLPQQPRDTRRRVALAPFTIYDELAQSMPRRHRTSDAGLEVALRRHSMILDAARVELLLCELRPTSKGPSGPGLLRDPTRKAGRPQSSSPPWPSTKRQAAAVAASREVRLPAKRSPASNGLSLSEPIRATNRIPLLAGLSNPLLDTSRSRQTMNGGATFLTASPLSAFNQHFVDHNIVITSVHNGPPQSPPT